MKSALPTAGTQDPAAFGPVLTRLAAGAARHPLSTLKTSARLGGSLARAGIETAARAVGRNGSPTLVPSAGDRRFSDPAWDDNAWFYGQRQAYLAWSKWLSELPGAAGLEGSEADKAAFALGLTADALAPTNFFLGNPTALRKAAETRGVSAVAGLTNLVADVVDNGARPRQVDATTFEVGDNLACTPGTVVFRNDLIELIQYAPQTETTFEVPLLLSPPWINRFYIMDLAPGRSFAEWAVGHGHTTFAISYRNPDATMRGVDLDDYLLRGLGAAVDAVCEITGAARLNVAGLCVGGTLGVMLAAYQAQVGDDRVSSLTLLNTLVDFSRPGSLGAFTDAEAVAAVEERMAETGFLDGRDMSTTFDLLRPNDLIWNYVGTNWLMGESPPAFDILAWNADATRVPEATHSSYLRSLYRENRLATGAMTMAGRCLALDDIGADTYVLAAEADHITPWKSSYATTGLIGSPLRFVLSSAGHIAGIVNPPEPERLPERGGEPERLPERGGEPERLPERGGEPERLPERGAKPKRKYWTNENVVPDPDAWRAGAVQHQGSWWEDWADWIETRAGGRRRPPDEPGSPVHPPLGDAPGSYVHG